MNCLSASSFILFTAPFAQAVDTPGTSGGPLYGLEAVGHIDQGLGMGTPANITPLLAAAAAAGTIDALGWNYKGTQAVNPQFQSGLQTSNLNFLKQNGLSNAGTEATLKSQTEKFVFGKETKLHPERGIESLVERYNAAVDELDKQIEIAERSKAASKNADAIEKAKAGLATLKTSKEELKTPFKILEKAEDGTFKLKPFKELKSKEARTKFFEVSKDADAKQKYLIADKVEWDTFASKKGLKGLNLKGFTLTNAQAGDLAKPGKELIEKGGEATRMWKMTPGIKNPWVAAAVGAAAVAGTIHLLSGIGNANRRLRGAV